MKKVKILQILYRDFIGYQFVFTLFGAYYLFADGLLMLPWLFWIKVVGYAVTGFWYFQMRRDRLYFYHNLGISIKRLIAYTLMVDWSLAIILYWLVYVFVRG